MIHSFKVATTLSAYRIVAISGNNQVAYPSGGQVLPIGITKDTVLDTTNSIPVAGPGERALCYFNDTMASAGFVQSDTSGRGVLWTPGANTTTSFTVTSCYVGILCGPSVGITGTLAEVFIVPGLARGA
jgi:hypothetical protein